MKFHLIQPGMIGRKTDIEKGMAGQNKELYQRYLEEIRATHVIGADLLTCKTMIDPSHLMRPSDHLQATILLIRGRQGDHGAA